MKLAVYFKPLSEQLNESQEEDLYDKSWTLFPVDKNDRPQRLPSIPLLIF
ncbi:MAG: hypothetical protein Q8P24_20765 [Desulfobacterales bacterium]|nr:hypothetical protein [Desulfobacterales bacterium]